jgi:L-rhamnose-H+ transport protein
MESIVLPFLLIIVASFFQGSFGVGMKYMSPLKWENWWLVHVSIAMVLFPLLWTFLSVSGYMPVIEDVFADPVAQRAASIAILFGFLWGIGGIMFGVSVPYIGLSLTMGIVMGIAGTLGALIPLLQNPNATSLPQFPYVIAGLGITIIGVVLTAKAGIDRDKMQGTSSLSGGNIIKGIIIAVVCGALSSLLAVGHTNVNDDVTLIAENYGINSRNASLIAWLIVFIGAYAMNALYSLVLIVKNNSWSNFSVAGSKKAYMWSIIAGLCWFAALGLYGQGAALMNGASENNLGNIVGWPMLLGLSLIVSNIWAYRSGEWKGAKKPFNVLLVGLAVLILASVILGYSNSLS